MPDNLRLKQILLKTIGTSVDDNGDPITPFLVGKDIERFMDNVLEECFLVIRKDIGDWNKQEFLEKCILQHFWKK